MSTYKGIPVEPEVLGELMELRERLATMAENANNLRAMLEDEIKHSSDLKQEIWDIEEAQRALIQQHKVELLERDTELLNARKINRDVHAVSSIKTACLLIAGVIIICLI